MKMIQHVPGDSYRGRLRGEAYRASYAPNLEKFGHKLQLVSEKPLVYTYKRFMQPSECDAFIDKAKQVGLEKLAVRLDGESYMSAKRTSSGVALANYEDPTIDEVSTRVGKLLNMPKSVENVEVKRYETEQFYLSHHDYFVGSNPERANNRVATVVIMLEPAELGGDLVFPFAVNATTGFPLLYDVSNRAKREAFVHDLALNYKRLGNHRLLHSLMSSSESKHDFTTVENAAFRLHMEKGDATIFYYYPPDPTRRCPAPGARSCLIAGRYFCLPKQLQRDPFAESQAESCDPGDRRAMHSSSPVLLGEKWSATYWFHESSLPTESDMDGVLLP